jgi:SUKH-3 immunity protein
MIDNKIFNKFSTESQKILNHNNINGNLKMPIQEIELAFTREGYQVSTIVKEFFELCVYSHISFLWNDEDDIYCKLIVDPTGYIDSEDRVDLDNFYNKNLSPIAYLSWGGIVMIDQQENIYLLEDGNLDFLGNDLVTGIEEIFKGKNWRLNS